MNRLTGDKWCAAGQKPETLLLLYLACPEVKE